MDRNSRVLRLALCIVLLGTGLGYGTVVRIDFGTADSPVRDGFVRVTDRSTFAAGAVAGWLDIRGLEAVDRPTRGLIYTTDLRQDSVQSRGPATLRVGVPPGKYRVWIMAGTGGGNTAQIWDMRIACGASSTKATFYGPHTARVMRLDAFSGPRGILDLTITTRSKWALNAMIVASAEEWPDLEKTEIAKLERDLTLLPDEFLKRWKHTPHQDNTPLPKYTPAEKARGFVIHHKPWVTPVWPNTVPRREEFDPRLKGFASQDEYEPLTFTVMPLRDFDSALVRVSDLRSEDGHLIPAQDISIRYVRYMYVRPNYNLRGIYYRAPDLLPRFDEPQPLRAGENFRVWLTVYVQPYTPEGEYRGRAALILDGQPAAEVPILFRVLPIKLQRDPSLIYNTYYSWHPADSIAIAPDDFSRRWWARKMECDFKSMAAHGYNAYCIIINAHFSEDGRCVPLLDEFAQKLDVARRNGLFDMGQPIVGRMNFTLRKRYKHYTGKEMVKHIYGVEMPPQAFFDDITAMVRAVEAGRKRRGWPEILYKPIDEPTDSKQAIQFVIEMLKAVKKVPGVRTYLTADPTRKSYAPLKPYVDVWCTHHFAVPLEQRLADFEERGVEYWCYPNNVSGQNDHTPVAAARMIYGFGLWRSGYRVLIPWTYRSYSGDPANYLDGHVMDFFNHSTEDDGDVIPCTLYEAYREGVDDYRYVTTLQRWIEQARQLGHDSQAAHAEADLKRVWDSIHFQAVKKILEVRNQYDTGWTADSFDNYRWLLAEHILSLKRLCER